MKVLLVDDSAADRDLIIRRLELHGHHVIWSSTAQGAITLLGTENGIGAAVLDVNLGPDSTMDGIALCALLPRGMPTVILTALDADEVRARALTAVNRIQQALAIVTKTTSYRELAKILASVPESP